MRFRSNTNCQLGGECLSNGTVGERPEPSITLNGKPVLALRYLKMAALLQPSAPDPHLFMADTFPRLGQKADAHREQAEGQRLRGTNER